MNEFNLIVIVIITAFLTNILFIYLTKNLSIYKHHQIQDIHKEKTPRLGGLCIVIIFFVYGLYEKIIYATYFIFFITLIPSMLEDINIQTKPLLRLFLILLTSFLLIYNLTILPVFNMGFLDNFFNNFYFQLVFFTLAIATVTNGQNIIDGTNGLSALTSLAIFTSLLILGLQIQDEKLVNTTLLIISLLIGFLMLNYPYGKIFLGDTGSYFLGLLSAYLVVDVFSKNPSLPSWSAVTILFYPTLEVLFSYFRKLSQRRSPFSPDNKHLHLKIYFLISTNKPYSRLYNALVAPFLGVIWLSPLALLPLSLHSPHLSLLILVLLIAVYLFFYFSIPDPRD